MKRRWVRIVTPLAAVILLMVGTVIVHEIAEPDTAEAHYLSPQPASAQLPTSGGQLADLLRAKGINIKRETRSSDALVSTWGLKGQATLFIPAPEFVHEDYLWMLRQSPADTRVVLVEPNARQLHEAVPLLGVAGTRWATLATAPGQDCELTTAGVAGVTRTRYGAVPRAPARPHACYDSGLVSVQWREIEFVVAGSADPFRTDRMAEHDNQALAVDLLSAKPNLIWLDLHDLEPKPRTMSEDYPRPGDPVPSLQPGGERERPDASPRPRSSFTPDPVDEGFADGGSQPPSPFPTWLLPLMAMLLLAAIALAFARGRRLGPPVTEPLPIDVPGAETALGRSQLYRRAKARSAALETLRYDARLRLATALKTSTDRDPLLDALAARTGQPRDLLETVLFGPEPEDDSALQTRTTELLRLVQQVTRE
ncbi:MAG TPA: DUF4350 domain-containing protein [Candidatus Limnocylindrales bacterium]